MRYKRKKEKRRWFGFLFVTLLATVSIFFVQEEHVGTEYVLLFPKHVSVEEVPKDVSVIEEEPSEPVEAEVQRDVPFTAQAPFGNWNDSRQQNGCEEASLVMAVYWARNEPLSTDTALEEILALSAFEEKEYGFYQDTDIPDTAQLLQTYFHFSDYQVVEAITVEEIQEFLEKGNVVIAPTDGRLLKNPYYTPPGPEHHMLVITEHDDTTDEFITNDPGTKRGEEYRYPSSILYEAIRNYPSGAEHQPAKTVERSVIVISSEKS